MKKIGLKILFSCLIVLIASGCATKYDTYTISRDNKNEQHFFIDRQKNKRFLLEDMNQTGIHGERILKASEKYITTEYKATQMADKNGTIEAVATKAEKGVINNYIVFTAPTDGSEPRQSELITTCADGVITNDYFIYLPVEFEKTR